MAGKRRVFGPAFKAKGGFGGRQGCPADGSTGEPVRIDTSQVTAWKKQLMAPVAELFAPCLQRRISSVFVAQRSVLRA